MDEMLQKVQVEIIVIGSKISLSRLYQHGFLDELKRLSKKNISSRLVISHDTNRQNMVSKVGSSSVRQVRADVTPLPHFILMDGKELLFFTSREDTPRKKVSAIWTNYSVFAKAMYILFTKIWSDSA